MVGAKILLVEDDPNLRGTIAEILQDEGYQVVAAESGERGIQAAAQEKFQLVITDVRLGPMDGVECLQEIRRGQPSVRAIIITGYASDEVPARAIKGQADDYIYKPFELLDLLLSVERALEGAQERKRYANVFSKIVAGAKRIFGAKTRTVSLEEARHQAFSAFYVGVRSHKLQKDDALNIWLRLEELERKDGEGEDELAKEFSILAGEIADSKPGRPRSEDFDPALFETLLANILSGKVSVELLKAAPSLRKLEPATLESYAPVRELHQTVWQ